MSQRNGSGRRRIDRNPAYRKAVTSHLPLVSLARQIGYVSMSSFYAALRFEKMPEPDKLAKFARFLGTSQGALYELWTKEMAR